MALVHSFEKNGNKLFKYRGQIPVILFVLAIPVIYFTDVQCIMDDPRWYYACMGAAIAMSVLGQVIRAIAIGTSNKNTSGRNTQEQVAEALNTKGIYSTVRHPLYLGNYFMWIGIVCFTFNIYFIIIVSLLFWIYYERIMFAEERFLERKFGDSYVNWSNSVPAFWPSMKNYIKGDIPFSIKTILRREYSGISATALGFIFVAGIREFFMTKTIANPICYVYWIAGALLFSLIFKLLKHKTKVLYEEDRS
ncbi:Isoprenylcysteine carboxyl methyltransferase (ICMT) family protein [compost metagenome]